MNSPKISESDYINVLIAAQTAYPCTEAEGVQPHSCNAPAHDGMTRLLHRMEPSPATLWGEAQTPVS